MSRWLLALCLAGCAAPAKESRAPEPAPAWPLASAPPHPPPPPRPPLRGAFVVDTITDCWADGVAVDEHSVYTACRNGAVYATNIAVRVTSFLYRATASSVAPLAIDRDRVYFSDGASVRSILKNGGGQPQQVFQGGLAIGLVVSNGELLVAVFDKGIYRVPGGGGAPQLLAAAHGLLPIAADSAHVFFIEKVSGVRRIFEVHRGTLAKRDLGFADASTLAAGGGWVYSSNPVELASGARVAGPEPHCSAFAADEKYAFARCYEEIYARPHSGDPWVPLGELPGDSHTLALGEGFICSTQGLEHTVLRCMTRPQNYR